MRLWSIDPNQLDRAALVAGWREGLLAQKVLRGFTKGYRQHPQLHRFQVLNDPVVGVGTWLHGLADAADLRGYRFNRALIVEPHSDVRFEVTDGQLRYEWAHLEAKVRRRDEPWLAHLGSSPRPHPMMDVVTGDIADWERT